jgi:hypothetical protein
MIDVMQRLSPAQRSFDAPYRCVVYLLDDRQLGRAELDRPGLPTDQDVLLTLGHGWDIAFTVFYSRPTTEQRETLGERIRALRVERGLSQRMVAMRLERDHALVVRWERDEREPSIWDVARLSRHIYRIPPEEMLDGVTIITRRTWSSRKHPVQRREELGRRLAAERERLALDAWDVLERSGVPGSRLRHVEGGGDPSLSELLALSRVYGRSNNGVPKVPRSIQTDPAGNAYDSDDPRSPDVPSVKVVTRLST